ncbi:ABC transporter ATP-binding protein [Tahibacter amnicola]|uniref:ABC transporter ATP-binding protein n=1 Tax=Tahibacter amnicola TaxID=2976241 RepID=A0ABY6BCK6_9GAMM|nr:ABC transporter ATP-binding protein [Tahibacter amnicola]UXI67776.1 ABC transporter ATP-binding protein [Tahibacter amnicola]
MSADLLVEARGLGKDYPHVFRRADRFRALLRLLAGRTPAAVTPVLRDVNLRVVRGQSLGLIGENGAGKSTLLKLLTGVLTPSHGDVTVNGRVGALLELGAGFHPEYSGRDNIAMSAALQGFDREELAAKLPEIVAFADIGRYIDEPVKHYSSGMVVRLGFAIIAATRPDLLITDEVLAVGDESFQKKCIRWIEDYLDGGGTLILVSHSMYHIQKLCRQALWLHQGQVRASGEVFDVTQAYLAHHERKTAETVPERDVEAVRRLEFHVRQVRMNGHEGEQPQVVEQGGSLCVEATIASRDGRVPVVHVGIVRADGTPVYGISSDMDGVQPAPAGEGDYRIRLHLTDLALLPGSYSVRVHPMDTEGMRLFDTVERAVTIKGRSREAGLVRLAHVWEHAAPLPATPAE